MSLIIEKIKKALSKSSSTNYVDEKIVHALGKKQDILTTLAQLLEERAIVSCRITKDGRTYNVYWLACQLAKLKHYSELFTPEKRLAISASKCTKPRSQNHNALAPRRRANQPPVANELPPRLCVACEKKLPPDSFSSPKSRRCVPCTEHYKLNKKALLAKQAREFRARKKAEKIMTKSQISDTGNFSLRR